MKDPNGQRLLNATDVERMTGYSRITIKRWMNDGKFPRSVQAHPNGHHRWREQDVQDWVTTRETKKAEQAE